MKTLECSIEFEVPNIDCCSVDPGDLDALSSVFSLLAAYADSKARAMRLRVAGDVECALSFEAGCESMYKRLPAWARW